MKKVSFVSAVLRHFTLKNKIKWVLFNVLLNHNKEKLAFWVLGL